MTLSILALVLAGAAPEPPTVHLETTRDHYRNVTEVRVYSGDELFTRYLRDPGKTPCLHPLIGPTGKPMTRDFPIVEAREGEAQDHPHHQSVWFAHGDVNGHDFWHGKEAHIDPSPMPLLTFRRDGRPGFSTSNVWRVGGEAVCGESHELVFDAQKSARTVDLRTTLGNRDAALTFGDTKEGTMAIRLHPELRLKGEVAKGSMRNSAGDEGRACWGKRAEWIAVWGPVEGEVCGLAMFDHPDNHAHPTWWHARDYGLLAANPFGVHDFEGKPEGTGDLTLPAGEGLDQRYRIYLFAGEPDFEQLQRAYEEWAASGTGVDGFEDEDG